MAWFGLALVFGTALYFNPPAYGQAMETPACSSLDQVIAEGKESHPEVVIVTAQGDTLADMVDAVREAASGADIPFVYDRIDVAHLPGANAVFVMVSHNGCYQGGHLFSVHPFLKYFPDEAKPDGKL